ncbi:FAD-dependent oxidoreductase [Streptomyces sp. SID3212]|uniref:FAD-dependent oxidoreductase n=1 Tax=Streptomyces sp. SID3212 TaxID=2690259 RepID=UPI001F2B96FC|nr:FAD-dependent oxidoreductase [Streptomyces sp. SID3212]
MRPEKSMKADVVVVGGGIIGLTTAIRLLELGASVLVVTDEALPARTSSVAAAVWYPTGLRAGHEITVRASDTYAELARQAADGVPGVTLGPCRTYTAVRDTARPWWATAVPGLRLLRTDEANGPWTDGWSFDAPTVDMPVYLDWLVTRFLTAGGLLHHRRINHLSEGAVWAPLIVNAAGLTAGSLCGDPTMTPVRGQLVLVSNPGLRISLRVQDHPEGYTYIHPRRTDVVLGGTFELDRWDLAPDPRTASAILSRCTALEPRLAGAPVLSHPVGLRPHRPSGVRLELDPHLLPTTPVIHNYGHSGSGVTLSWGCADEVARLAATA